MKFITSITDEPKQEFTLRLDNNETATMRLYFYQTQNSWYYDIEYNGYINNGNKAVLTFNALRHLRKRLPFGISFMSINNADPCVLDAFSSKKWVAILLNQEDIDEIERNIFNNEPT